MTAELTAEEIVTNLLSSHQILGRGQKFECSINSDSLGDYLKNLPNEIVTNYENDEDIQLTKYTFIKNKWKI